MLLIPLALPSKLALMNGAFCRERRNGQGSQSSLSSQASAAWGEVRARPRAAGEGKQQFLRGFRGVLEAEGSSQHLGLVTPFDSAPALWDSVPVGIGDHESHPSHPLVALR